MTICPNCSAAQPDDSTKFCGFCGKELLKRYDADDIDESKDFEVSETLDNGLEFFNSQNQPVKPLDNDLGIETNADLLETGAISQDSSGAEDDGLIGQSWPPVASYLDELENDKISDDNHYHKEINEKSDIETSPQIKSDERKELENKLFNFENNNNKPSLKNHEKQPEVVNPEPKIVEDEKLTPIPSAEQVLIRPKITPRSRGIAYFYKNYIELIGKQPLFSGDEIEVNNRIYVLKPKRVRPSFLYGGITAILILSLLFIGSFFIDNT